MFTGIFLKPLQLDVDGKVLTFNSVEDFEFALASRTEVPWKRVAGCFKRSDEELKSEAEGIKQVEKRFVDVLAKSLENETTLGKHIRGMDIKLFSQDHQWRSIMTAIYRQDPEYDEFKRKALIKYLQYLSSRQEVVQKIYSDRKAQHDVLWESRNGHEGAPNPALKETVIFDLTQVSPAESAKRKEKFVRIPKGEAVDVPMQEGKEVIILFSKHRFRLVPGQQCYLVDENGADYLLHKGINAVGRDTTNDVTVNAAYRDVSRRHAVVDIKGSDLSCVTDLSSHGTFLSPQYLDHTSNSS